jgi:hypothetical protein
MLSFEEQYAAAKAAVERTQALDNPPRRVVGAVGYGMTPWQRALARLELSAKCFEREQERWLSGDDHQWELKELMRRCGRA